MRKITSVIILLSVTFPAYGQINSVFEKWQNSNRPGCVVAVVKGDQLIYSNGFGLANIETGFPNTPETVYYMASVAKQFTGYAIALLMREGKISPDEDVRKYLPWLPDFKYKITVANLLNHTSGLKNDLALSQQAALSTIKQQQTLNFVPGEKFEYSNPNYVLLAEIIKHISGQNFPAFMDSAIFKPLGMTQSRFVESPDIIIKGRADSYSLDNTNVLHNIYTVGDGGMFSSATDLAKWMINFYHPVVGDKTDVKRFSTPGVLNNGDSLNYGMGIISDLHRRQKRLFHKGALAGYKTFIAVYPELEMGIVIMTNGDDGPKTNVTMEELAELFIPLR